MFGLSAHHIQLHQCLTDVVLKAVELILVET